VAATSPLCAATVEPAPTIFAPGVISSAEYESAPAFTPDGETVYFGRNHGPASSIMESHLIEGGWSKPTIATFSGRWNDLEPAMAPDGRYMIFISSRPIDGGTKPIDGHFNGDDRPGRGGNLWRVDRKGSGWSEPVRLPDVVNASHSTFAPAVVADGSLYFMRPATVAPGRFQLFRSQFNHGTYETPQPLPFSDGSVTTVDAAVAPDESFMVLGAGFKPENALDLFIVFRKDGVWGKPIHMGDKINSPGSEAEVRLSPDLKTVYFSSVRIDPSVTADWNNGKYNIWSAPLAYWLQGAR
jgi:WD40-like Beta Propeller Repeat